MRFVRVIVFRLSLQDSEWRQVTIGQSSTNLNFVPNSFKEMELMCVLIMFTWWIRVIENTVNLFVFKLGNNFLPGSEKSINSGMGFLEFFECLEHSSIDFTNGMFGNIFMWLNVSGWDGHSETNFKHMPSIFGCLVSKSMLIRSLPWFHNRVTFNLEMGWRNDSFFFVFYSFT